jgi:hypothetical protein
VGEPLAPLARLLAADRPAFGEALRELLERAETERVEIACGGGIGRTGTALACLAVLDGVPNDEAVTYVRQNYSRRAVETPWQKRFVARFAVLPPGRRTAAAPRSRRLPPCGAVRDRGGRRHNAFVILS